MQRETNMEEVNNLLDIIGEKLVNVVNSDRVGGSPISLGNVTIVPMSGIRLGFGGGGGEGGGPHPYHMGKKDSMGYGQGSALGGGGGGMVRPVAVAAFTEEGVEIFAVPQRRGLVEKIMEKEGTLDKILDRIPELIDKIKGMSK